MGWMQDAINKDKKELQSLFQEEIELQFHDLGKTYSKLRLTSVNGIPIESKQRPIFYFYKDDIYIPIDKRDPDYKGTLVAYDMGRNPYRAEFFFSEKIMKSSFVEKGISITDVLNKLYTNAHRY